MCYNMLLEMGICMKYMVEIWEYEKGWDSRLEQTVVFSVLSEAEEFVEYFNSDEPINEDWYMIALPAEEVK